MRGHERDRALNQSKGRPSVRPGPQTARGERGGGCLLWIILALAAGFEKAAGHRAHAPGSSHSLWVFSRNTTTRAAVSQNQLST